MLNISSSGACDLVNRKSRWEGRSRLPQTAQKMGESSRSFVCVEKIGQRRKPDWDPRAHVVSIASDFQRRVSGVQNQLGVCVHDGKRTIAQFGQLIDSGRGFLAHRYSALAHGYNGRDAEQNLEGKKLWMSLLGFGAQIQARVERRRVETTESMLHIVRGLKDVHCRSSRPLFATLSLGSGIADVPVEAKHVFDIAMSSEQVAKRLDGVPVYTVSNAANEFVLISDLNTSKSLGIFCFREEDAEALLSQVLAVSKEFYFVKALLLILLMQWLERCCHRETAMPIIFKQDKNSHCITNLLHSRCSSISDAGICI